MSVTTLSMSFSGCQPALQTPAANQSAIAPISADAEACRLAQAVARGDEAAFQQLYDAYQPRLFRLALVLAQGDETMAQEAVQSALLTAARKLKPVAGADHLWHWLARVTRQHLAKTLRQRRREPLQVDLAEAPEPATDSAADAALTEHLEAALQLLDAEERQIIEWFYFDGLSCGEIAGRLQTTIKAVSSRLERTRAAMRSAVKRRLTHES